MAIATTLVVTTTTEVVVMVVNLIRHPPKTQCMAFAVDVALRAWFECFFKALFDLGFKDSKTDPSLFIYSRRDTLLYILVYVDEIIVTGNSDTSFEAFSDADWLEIQMIDDDRRSTGEFAIYLCSNIISWTARKQRTISCSSPKAEYKDLADTVIELTWIQALLNELGICSSSTPILWCDNLDDRWSTGEFAIYLGSNLISWTARKQRTISCSSPKAEYKDLADTVVELTWLQALLNELEICSSSTPILWCDNLGATYLSANPIFYACTKHVKIDYHFVRISLQSHYQLLNSSF
nr:uncharacterized mitochondrial protein AtMg00810-like isoform X1 [Tanacetum cinerariifolium]